MEIKKVTGQYKDDEGNLKEQLEIHFELENGYRSQAWIAYYEQPGDKSALGKLALKIQQITKREIGNIDEFLTAFKGHGQGSWASVCSGQELQTL